MATKEQTTKDYETNPLKLAWNGIKEFKNKAPTLFWTAIVLSVLSALNTIRNLTADTAQSNQASEAQLQAFATSLADNEVLAIGFIALAMAIIFLSISLIAWGIGGYAAARLAEGKSVSFREAFDASLDAFSHLLKVWIILTLKVIGWSLLFVIPGIIMAVRYSLTSVVAFAEPTLSANQTSKKSADLTKDAWFDTFGTLNLLNIITLGLVDLAIDVAAKSKLYEQLSRIKASGAKKPPTHPLSYLTVVVFLFFTIAVIVLQSPAQA